MLFLDKKDLKDPGKLKITGWIKSTTPKQTKHKLKDSELPPIEIVNPALISLLNRFPVIKIGFSLRVLKEQGVYSLSVCLPPSESEKFEKECASIKVIKHIANMGDTGPGGFRQD